MKSDVYRGSESKEATCDLGKVRLGDMAPVFPTRGPKKVERDAATDDSGKVRLGDMAPIF